jgi:hypothetical protein
VRLAFWIIAAAFALAALFHVAALVAPSIAEPSPPWRHLLFAATNVAVAVGMVRRPRLFVVAFALLTVQQVVSHGAYAWTLWASEGRVDWASAVVLASMPAVLALLIFDARRSSGVRAFAQS